MHKFCLTEPECERIQGSQQIIETLGHFPSMENMILEEIKIIRTHHPGNRYEVSLVFDLSCGGRRRIPGGKPRIRMTFYGIRDVYLNTDPTWWQSCMEIKFTNIQDRTLIRRDDLPSTTPIVPRPFSGFAIGTGRDFFLEFFDEEVTVDAFLID